MCLLIDVWVTLQGRRGAAHLTSGLGISRDRAMFYLVSGDGVSGEINKQVIVRGEHGTGILIQHHLKGFPDGCAVLVPGQMYKLKKKFKIHDVM